MLDISKIKGGTELYFVNSVMAKGKFSWSSIEYGKFIEFFQTIEDDGWTFQGIRFYDLDGDVVEKSTEDYNIGIQNTYNQNETFLTLKEAEAYVGTLRNG